MKTCPNCSAELTTRPCPACGWPETTRVEPPKVPFWKRALREELGPDADPETSVRGCCGSGLWHLALGGAGGALVGYLIRGEVGAAGGAVVGGLLGIWLWWSVDV